MLRFTDVTKEYPGGFAALSRVSLHVPRGQFCVVLGSSGAGKSTLLRAVNGLSPPTSGTVEVDGVVVTRKTLQRVRTEIATVHQQFNLVGRLTVLTNVLTGALGRVSTARALVNWFPAGYRRKACSLLAEVGLEEEHLYRRASRLSGGQQQRVAIARAFVLDPKVVLADEPVASLDQASSRTIMHLLRRTSAQRGATVLCSLHQVDLAREFADRVVGMRAGEVIYDGPPSALDPGVLAQIYEAGDGPAPAVSAAGESR
ncbi:MAG: phosphonate ABC transporter ATP-binding protein [Polyangiaceae bacterium]|nr:phosphonate ABC transporter ATP-binding protein [Polyangiaceae bacterium]